MPKPDTGYPAPLVIEPLRSPHKQTFIILHGRGSTADKFGPVLLETKFPLSNPGPEPASSAQQDNASTSAETTTLRALFPHARFVFPTAARRRATVYGRSYTHQWFDNWKLDPPATEREELQGPGLRETVLYLRSLVWKEIGEVPGGDPHSVMLGGLSQGCAASLVNLLLWEGQELAGIFGMCGWLPFGFRLGQQLGIESQTGEECNNDEEDPFERDDDPFERSDDEDELFGRSDDDDEETKSDPAKRAINYLREEIELDGDALKKKADLACKKIPVFLGHGVEDDRVSVVLGRTAYGVLRGIGVDAEWKEYEGLMHWYSGEMLRDLVGWIGRRVGWEVAAVTEEG